MEPEPDPAMANSRERTSFSVSLVSPTTVEPRGRTARLLAGLLRFLGLWVGISGTYALMCGTCPFCGRPGCPVGIGAAGILGALGSFLVYNGRALLKRAWLFLRRDRDV